MDGDPTVRVRQPVTRRAMSIGPQDVFLLDQWGRQLAEAFGKTAYLVGSVARAEPTWRDVDLRMLAPKAFFDPPARIRSLNVALSLWGRHVTGLPIDFQFQLPDDFHSYDGQIRNPMGTRSARGFR